MDSYCGALELMTFVGYAARLLDGNSAQPAARRIGVVRGRPLDCFE
jgi:hypothetical protein